MTSFPDGFVWGTATAAHQVEGGNTNSDWWAWENAPDSVCAEPSGDACDHFNRYSDDIAMLAELGFGAYRFSVEWARIEPSPGEFSQAMLDHYAAMARTCREHGLEPIITLHHFTTPQWAAADGGWENPAIAARFESYTERVADALADSAARWCTINEPNIVSFIGYVVGVFPPGVQDKTRRDDVNRVLVDAHRRAVAAFRRASDAPVGLTLAMSEYEAAPGAEQALRRHLEDHEGPFLEAASDDDFIGVQTYAREIVGPDGGLFGLDDVEKTMVGWEYRPGALEVAIRRAHEATGVPILVTENGIATADDARRIDFVHEALKGVLRCVDSGIPVQGYCYWSALDNFEWALGYHPTFGLIAVDRVTQQRRVKESARWLGALAQANTLPPR